MSQIAIAPPINCTHSDLALIVANASFLWERLDLKHFTADNEQAAEIARRLNHWCQVIAKGNWDTMQKRLQWEGLDLDTVRPWLGMQFTTTQPLPEWAETLRQIIQTAAEFTPASESFLPTEPENPIPFEEILLETVSKGL
jgi:hypothetical protein